MEKKLSRRSVLWRGLQLPIGAGAVLALAACDDGGRGETAVACADPGAMTSAEESVRRTLKYTEISSDPARTCSACEFFHAAEETGACGSCEMFGGKPVNPGGHCDSWSVDS
jgi:hypothetical protein